MFQDNGPPECTSGATTFADKRGCLEPDEVVAVSSIPGKGFGVGHNSKMREVGFVVGVWIVMIW